MALQEQSYASYFEAEFPAEGDVRQSITYSDGVTLFVGSLVVAGSPNYPAESEVLLGVTFGTLGSEEFTGNYRPNIVGDVRVGKVFGSLDSETGVLDLPSINDVENGVQFDNLTKTGNFVAPDAADVRDGVGYGSLGTEFTGTLVVGACDYPATSDVRAGVAFDSGGQTGTLDLPNVSDVRLNVQFDGNSKTGTLNIDTEANLPLTGQVLDGVTYGSSLQFTGTLDPGGEGAIPVKEDVRFGVPTGNQVGVLLVPMESQVLVDIGFGSNGTEYTGALTHVPPQPCGVVPPTENCKVLSPLYIGDSFLAANGNAFIWTIAKPGGFTTPTGRFVGRDACGGCAATDAWDVASTGVDDGSGNWVFTLEMTSSQTSLIGAGHYSWTFTIEEGATAITQSEGEVEWRCR